MCAGKTRLKRRISQTIFLFLLYLSSEKSSEREREGRAQIYTRQHIFRFLSVCLGEKEIILNFEVVSLENAEKYPLPRTMPLPTMHLALCLEAEI